MARAAAFALLLAGLGLGAAGCGGGGGTAAGTTTTASSRAAAFQSFETCLKGRGITLPSRPFGPTRRPRAFTRRHLTPAQQKAFQACRSKLPSGGRSGPGRRAGSRNPAFARYTQCLAKHGVKFGVAGDRTTFAKAQAACRSLLPARTPSSG